jgi:DNA polymerase III delta prime subunit
MDMSISPLSNLIYNLKSLRDEESPMIRSIGDFESLLSGLEELNSMVEMDSLKDSVVKQIKFLLVNSSKFQVNEKSLKPSPFDGHMLHTVIYGPPGVGKTEVCKILVKIWLGLGIIKRPGPVLSQQPDNSSDSNTTQTLHMISEHINVLIVGNKIKDGIIDRLQERIADMKDDFNILEIELENIQTLLRKLKRKNYKKPDKIVAESSIYDHVNRRIVEPNDEVEIINNISSEIRKIQTKLGKKISTSTPDEKIKFGLNVIDFNSNQTPKNNIEPNIPMPLSIISPPTLPLAASSDYSSEDKNIDVNNFVKIVSRDDFIAGYLGQSALKTEKLLRESLGKVLFIDEAYSLVNDEKDSYGREAATVLNRFMSEHPDELIVIFAGYKDLMAETIFRYQPGLKSRCAWTFEIDGYTEKGLTEIFKSQISHSGWALDTNINLDKFFKKHINNFKAYGRDTHRLVFYCKMCYAETVFNNNESHNKIITKKILNCGINYLKQNQIKDGSEYNIIHTHMYI